MRASRCWLPVAAALMVVPGLFTACQTDQAAGSSGSGGAYYGTELHDPWYGGAPIPPEVIVPPPQGTPPPRPAQPIALPPSIPSAPRPMPVMRR